MKNTKKRGQFTIFVYRERANHYIGVCLEFDLIEEGENAREVMKQIQEASVGYLKTVIKNNLDDDLLNKKAPLKYQRKYQELLKLKKKESAIPREEFLRKCLYPQVLQVRSNV